MAEESQSLSFRGIRVHFRVCAPEDRPVERGMLLSSPLISSFHWRKVVPELVQLGCLTVCIDLPGFGRSDCSRDVPQDGVMRANMLWGVLDEIDRQSDAPDSMWHLIGHGSAAAAIMMMTLYQADSVKSRVLISPVFDRFMPYPLQLLLETPVGKKLIDLWFRKKILDRRGFAILVRRVYGGRVSKARMEALRRSICRRGMPDTLARLMREGYRLPENA